jgi:hypothetical protein
MTLKTARRIHKHQLAKMSIMTELFNFGEVDNALLLNPKTMKNYLSQVNFDTFLPVVERNKIQEAFDTLPVHKLPEAIHKIVGFDRHKNMALGLFFGDDIHRFEQYRLSKLMDPVTMDLVVNNAIDQTRGILPAMKLGCSATTNSAPDCYDALGNFHELKTNVIKRSRMLLKKANHELYYGNPENPKTWRTLDTKMQIHLKGNINTIKKKCENGLVFCVIDEDLNEIVFVFEISLHVVLECLKKKASTNDYYDTSIYLSEVLPYLNNGVDELSKLVGIMGYDAYVAMCRREVLNRPVQSRTHTM